MIAGVPVTSRPAFHQKYRYKMFRHIYMPPLTGKREQQQFTVWSGVVTSTSSRWRGKVSSSLLRKQTEFRPTVAARQTHFQPATHGLHPGMFWAATTFYFCSEYYRVLITTDKTGFGLSWEDSWDKDKHKETAVVVPVTRCSTIGDRPFPVATARALNSLPSFVTSSSSLSTFKRHLKTYLFATLYWWRCWPSCFFLCLPNVSFFACVCYVSLQFLG